MDMKGLAGRCGLTEREFSLIEEVLGREPTPEEVGIFGVMWSEHCSYKSSKSHLSEFPVSGERVVEGPGENAGIVALDEEMGVAFKMESHNHPSFIEPYQGAATGVGGILRDIFTMGARPLALADSLRFGDLSDRRMRHLLKGVVAGIAGYGNCVGVPTVAGETSFYPAFQKNILVNVLCLGALRMKDMVRGRASGPGNHLVLFGSSTGRDGIHGATMASREFSGDSEEKRPNVQVGDPFTEKLLIEATLELIREGVVTGIQDMGAGGITGSSAEMGGRGGCGIYLNLDAVPLREDGMSPYEILISESQERMLMVVRPGDLERAKRVISRWGLEFAVVGEVKEGRHFTASFRGKTVARIPLSALTADAPLYRRGESLPLLLVRPSKVPEIPSPPLSGMEEAARELLRSPNLSSKRWIYEQYDHMVRTNTVIPPGGDSALIRIKGKGIGVSITTDSNPQWTALNPFEGGALSVLEAFRNTVSVGAEPVAITNCLNFGNPEKGEVMWSFRETIEGMAAVLRRINLPVVSGNVSFYNETDGIPIWPTATVGMVGVRRDLSSLTRHPFVSKGDAILLAGEMREEAGLSEYLRWVHGVEPDLPPSFSIEEHLACGGAILEASGRGLLGSCHDLSDGGLFLALLESCLDAPFDAGLRIDLSPFRPKRLDLFLFGEPQGPFLISARQENLDEIMRIFERRGVALKPFGMVTDRGILHFEGVMELERDELVRIREDALRIHCDS